MIFQHNYFSHIVIFIYIIVAIIIIYKPPATSRGLGSFIERHFGDSVGFYILHLGIVLVVIGGVYPQIQDISQTGQSLILAGMVALKLTKTPSDNGNKPVDSFKVTASNEEKK